MNSTNERANELLNAWLRGMTHGGHVASKQDIAEAFATCVERAEHEAQARGSRGAK